MLISPSKQTPPATTSTSSISHSSSRLDPEELPALPERPPGRGKRRGHATPSTEQDTSWRLDLWNYDSKQVHGTADLKEAAQDVGAQDISVEQAPVAVELTLDRDIGDLLQDGAEFADFAPCFERDVTALVEVLPQFMSVCLSHFTL